MPILFGVPFGRDGIIGDSAFTPDPEYGAVNADPGPDDGETGRRTFASLHEAWKKLDPECEDPECEQPVGFWVLSEKNLETAMIPFEADHGGSDSLHYGLCRASKMLCNACHKSLEINDFGTRAEKGQGGRRTYCKPCFSTYICKRFNAKKIAACRFLGDKCSKCQQSFPYPIYNFHHRDPSTKEFQWQKLRLQSIETILRELSKCDLVCANCHTEGHSSGPAWEGLDEMVTRFTKQMQQSEV